jgi:glycosyltransferase involved in cell wall biosynthesis
MYRSLAAVNAFARAGFRVTVLTVTRDTYERLTGSDPESEREIDAAVEVVRIPFDPDRGETDIGRWSRLRVFSPLLWNFLRWQRYRLTFPENSYAVWYRPVVEAAERIHAADPIDLVIGTANPNVDFAPGDVLHRRHRVPYVMDYRDGWNLDVYTGRRFAGTRSRAARLEARMLASATEAWFVNAPIRDWHRREHPEIAERLHVVANGWDPNFLTPPPHLRAGRQEGLVFGYLGTIYGPIPLRETLEGWREARRSSPLIARSRLVFRGRLGHFAEPDAVAAALLEEFRDDGVSYEGPVSKTGVSEVYADVDVLLLIISRSPYVTSGKVYEYAATGLPIVSIHHPDTGATSVISGRPSWFPIAEVTPEAIAEALTTAGEHAIAMTDEDLREAQAWARPLARDAQFAPRIAALRSILEEGRS